MIAEPNIQAMPRKPIELPAAVARSFVKEMCLYQTTKGHHQTRRDRSAPSVVTQRASGSARQEAAADRREADVRRDEGITHDQDRRINH